MTTITEIMSKLTAAKPQAQTDKVQKAYTIACQAHEGQVRASGERFITHPLEVAALVAEICPDEVAIAAALVHDVVEDTLVTIDHIRKECGPDVARIVQGLTNIGRLEHWTRAEYDAANVRKVLLAGTQDLRILFVKLCDRMHNMRTLDHLSQEQQQRIAKEVLEVYAPLAYRLGMHVIKAELEDRAFKYVYPEEYTNIVTALADTQEEREHRIESIQKQIKERIAEANIRGEITGRVKPLYSIYRKTCDRKYDVDRMYDIVAVRIITQNSGDCYRIFALIHELWKPIPGTVKDYIAMPKPNGYQSLHTSVIYHDGKPVEFQLRTEDMHCAAEEGIAVHWGYKGVGLGGERDKRIAWMKQLLEDKSVDSTTFLENVKADFFSDTICVFTPKGEVIELPPHATVLDFGYAVHSRVGEQAIGGKINGRFTSLRTQVSNGDNVEVITAKYQKPRNSWLKCVITSKAKTNIKRYLRQEGITPITVQHTKKDNSQARTHTLLSYSLSQDTHVVLAKCCKPLPGQKVIGYLTGTKQLRVHCSDCHVLQNKNAQQYVHVNWLNDIHGQVEVVIEGKDRLGLFAEIVNIFAREGLSMQKTSAYVLNKEFMQARITLKIETIDELQQLLERISRVKDVVRVYIGEMVRE